MANPCGLLISAQGKDFNRSACIQHVQTAQYTTCSVLDDLTLAIDLHIPYAVFRSYPFEPQPKGNDQNAGFAAADLAFGQLMAWRKSHPGSENVLFMVNCEQGFGIGVSWMYARLIQRCATEVNPPIGLVVGNWASGAVKCGQGNEPNAWIDAGEPILRAMEKYGDKTLPNGSWAFVLGVHEYTALFAWIASNGGKHEQTPRWENRPQLIDWSLPQWHLGRMAQGIMEACDHFKIQRIPRMIVTECLFDTMNDVIDRLGPIRLAPGYDKPRGWRSLVPQWMEWYPGKDPAEVLADQHIWTWETIYKPLGFVIGTHTYIYERTDDPNWISFQVDEADALAYRRKMESYGKTTSPPPLPDPDPEPPKLDIQEALREIRLAITQIQKAIINHEAAGNELQVALLTAQLLEERLIEYEDQS